MTDPGKGPPVDDPSVVVGGDNKKPDQKDVVAYETHQKLLNEKKKVQEQRDALIAEKEEAERKKLEEQGEYKKLRELAEKRADEALKKLAEFEAARLQGKKARAIITALDSGIDEKFYDMLPIDQVLVDPDTGEINATSVAEVAANFKTKYPELLKTKSGVKMPNAAPLGNAAGMIARSDWMKLTSKEMLKYKPDQIIGS